MAFLIPALVSGLASLFAPTVARKLTGSGGRTRSRGGALSVMNKWPALERPARYAIGGNLPQGPLGRRTVGRGGATGVHPVRGYMQRRFGGPEVYVAPHLARNPRPHMVHSYMAAGMINPMLALAGLQPGLSHVMRGGRASPHPHFVRPHMAVSDLGNPYHVRGYYAGGKLQKIGNDWASVRILGSQERRNTATGKLRPLPRARRGARRAPPTKYTLEDALGQGLLGFR